MPGIRFHVAVCIALLVAGTATASDWELDGSITVPHSAVLFMAKDASGNLYATTFNPLVASADVVAVRVSDPNAARPKVTVFDRFTAPTNRGYAGIAVDEDGGIYVSVDMGDSIPSYIRKFKPTLEPDLNFGNKGALATNELRVLGLTAYKKRILAAVSWGRFLAIDSDGRFLGVTRPLPGGMDVKIRDIDFIPETQTVVGADRDGVFIFAGGTLDDLSRYTVRPLIPVKGVPKAGSAVYFGALTNEIFYTDGSNGGMSIVSISGAPAGSIRNDFSTRGPLQAADTVMSWDGNYLYVSDLRAPQILRYRKAGAVVPPAVASPAIAPPAGMTPAPPDSGLPIPGPTTSNWLDSLDAGFAAAAGGGRKVVVLFGAPMAEKSREIELGVLNEQFRRLFPDAAWVKVDVSAMPDAMTRYNFYKVPVVIIFSGDRKELKRFEGGFAQQEFTSAYQVAK